MRLFKVGDTVKLSSDENKEYYEDEFGIKLGVHFKINRIEKCEDEMDSCREVGCPGLINGICFAEMDFEAEEIHQFELELVSSNVWKGGKR